MPAHIINQTQRQCLESQAQISLTKLLIHQTSTVWQHDFIVKMVEALKDNRVIPTTDTMFECTDVDTVYYLGNLENNEI